MRTVHGNPYELTCVRCGTRKIFGSLKTFAIILQCEQRKNRMEMSSWREFVNQMEQRTETMLFYWVELSWMMEFLMMVCLRFFFAVEYSFIHATNVAKNKRNQMFQCRTLRQNFAVVHVIYSKKIKVCHCKWWFYLNCCPIQSNSFNFNWFKLGRIRTEEQFWYNSKSDGSTFGLILLVCPFIKFVYFNSLRK